VRANALSRLQLERTCNLTPRKPSLRVTMNTISKWLLKESIAITILAVALLMASATVHADMVRLTITGDICGVTDKGRLLESVLRSGPAVGGRVLVHRCNRCCPDIDGRLFRIKARCMSVLSTLTAVVRHGTGGQSASDFITVVRGGAGPEGYRNRDLRHAKIKGEARPC
jgi:hypothetical protein